MIDCECSSGLRDLVKLVNCCETHSTVSHHGSVGVIEFRQVTPPLTKSCFPLFHTLSLAVLAISSRVLMVRLETMVTG